MPIISVTLPSDNTSANVADYNTPITTILSTLNGGLDDDNIDSLSGTKIIADTLPQSALTATSKNGWITGVLPAQSGSVTNNGQGSYDIPFASTVAGILSPQMKLQVVRTTAASTYMGGAFNGTSHYFVKATPTSTLSTVTNNFSIRAVVEPTAYAQGAVVARSDAAANNAMFLRMEADGTITLAVINTAAANFRRVSTRQSVPLNKKTKIWATWSSGTVVIYFDGIAVPLATAITGGTAPTTAGTGGDFAIGRIGSVSTQYFTGYISDVAVFNAVLSQSTIRSYDSQPLLGSESNCIGAWSLNNTNVNQQAPGTNDVTPTGSVGYTSGKSPYGTDGSGVSAGTTDVALVMSVSGSTATVQVPEGCTIPTSGGITSVAHSTDSNPFGWVADKGRWKVSSLFRVQTTTTSNATWGNFASGGWAITIPVGIWAEQGYTLPVYSGDTTSTYWTLSPTSVVGGALASEDINYTSRVQSASATTNFVKQTVSLPLVLSAVQTWTLYTLGATTAHGVDADNQLTEFFAIPAGI